MSGTLSKEDVLKKELIAFEHFLDFEFLWIERNSLNFLKYFIILIFHLSL